MVQMQTCSFLVPEDLVDIIGEQAADSHHLSRPRGCNGHQHNDSNQGAPTLAKDSQGRCWWNQAYCNIHKRLTTLKDS